MYITCPECTTRYVVKADAVGDKGRTVKCAKCGHKWFQAPAGVEENERIRQEVSEDIPRTIAEGSGVKTEERRLPMKSTKTFVVPVPGVLKFALWLLLCLAPFFGLVAYKDLVLAQVPALAPAYHYLGLLHDKGIALYDIALIEEPWEGNPTSWISGSFINESEQEQSIKKLRVVFLDKEHKKLGERFFPSSHREPMKPGEELAFKVPVPAMPEETTYVIVDVGDSISMMVR